MVEKVDVVAAEREQLARAKPAESGQEQESPEPAAAGLVRGLVHGDDRVREPQHDLGRHERPFRRVPLAGAPDIARVADQQLVGHGGVEHCSEHAVGLCRLVVARPFDQPGPARPRGLSTNERNAW